MSRMSRRDSMSEFQEATRFLNNHKRSNSHLRSNSRIRSDVFVESTKQPEVKAGLMLAAISVFHFIAKRVYDHWSGPNSNKNS